MAQKTPITKRRVSRGACSQTPTRSAGAKSKNVSLVRTAPAMQMPAGIRPQPPGWAQRQHEGGEQPGNSDVVEKHHPLVLQREGGEPEQKHAEGSERTPKADAPPDEIEETEARDRDDEDERTRGANRIE